MCCVLEGPGQVTRSQSHRSLGAPEERGAPGAFEQITDEKTKDWHMRERKEAGSKRGGARTEGRKAERERSRRGAPLGLAFTLERKVWKAASGGVMCSGSRVNRMAQVAGL